MEVLIVPHLQQHLRSALIVFLFFISNYWIFSYVFPDHLLIYLIKSFLFLTRYFICLWRRQWHPTPMLCLKNPMDGGAWKAAVHGIARSHTHLATSLSLFTFMHWRRKWQPTPVFLPGESQGWGSLVAAVCGVTQSRTQLKWLSSHLSL